MPKSKRSSPQPETLTDLLNGLYSESKILEVRGWNEYNGHVIRLSIDFGKCLLEIERKLETRELVQMVWRAGMIPSKNDEELSKVIDDALENPGNRTVALALDTNLVISHFYPNYMNLHHPEPYKRLPHFLVVPSGVDHELHYKLSNTFRKSAFVDRLEGIHNRDQNYYRLMTGSYKEPTFDSQDPIYRVASHQGRIGIKGLREMRRLQEKHRVIISMPAHLYYSERIQTETKFVDAVFDSLIRYEVSFLQKNTNTRIIFLTADKHQRQSAQNEGMETLYVQQPTYGGNLKKIEKSRFKISNIGRLIEELLVYSPCIKISSGDVDAYLASAWEAMGPEESRLGRVMAIVEDKRIILKTD